MAIGDSCFGDKEQFVEMVRALAGDHYFMDGSHDWALEEYFYWDDKPKDVEARVTILPKLFEFTYNGSKISLCHYKMDKFWCSHYPNSFHFYGHSHQKSPHNGRAIDVGVDGHNFFPIFIEAAIELADKNQAKQTNNPPKEL